MSRKKDAGAPYCSVHELCMIHALGLYTHAWLIHAPYIIIAHDQCMLQIVAYIKVVRDQYMDDPRMIHISGFNMLMHGSHYNIIPVSYMFNILACV